jgi:hypothetical protein
MAGLEDRLLDALNDLRRLGGPAAGTAVELRVTQAQLDRADLIVLAGHDGIVWRSARHDREQAARMLHDIADRIAGGTL